eukprot:ANDGO_05484.mRNA.1 Tyrosine decarboxylase 1
MSLRDLWLVSAGAAAGASAVLMLLYSGRRQNATGAGASPSSTSPTEPITTAQGFRVHAKSVVDWIADYYSTLASSSAVGQSKYSVLSAVKPGYLATLLPENAPEQAEDFRDVFADFEHFVMPGVTHWQSPNFFAYFPANSSFPGIVGEMLSAAINCIGFSWINSPACTELETVVMDWLARALDLPAEFLSTGKGGGVIQGTASESVLVAMLAARHRKLATLASTGESGALAKDWTSKFVVYASDQAHSSITKAFKILGIDGANLRLLPSDSKTFSFSPVALFDMVMQDTANGLVPFFVCATVGTTSVCAFDPLTEIGGFCNSNGMWLHVDAAYAGSACICPEYRKLLNGVEYADSFNFNAHKWMLVNFDCSCMWVKDRSALLDVLSITPEYLRNKWTESGTVTDYRDWQIPLGRRFRAIKLWLVLRCYGLQGIRSHIRKTCELAEVFSTLVTSDPSRRFSLFKPTVLSLVCFRLNSTNAANRAVLDRLNSLGTCFLVHSVVHGTTFLRFAVGVPCTKERHVVAAWKEICNCADEVLKNPPTDVEASAHHH